MCCDVRGVQYVLVIDHRKEMSQLTLSMFCVTVIVMADI